PQTKSAGERGLVKLNGLDGDFEGRGDFLAGVPFGDELEDLTLAGREPVGKQLSRVGRGPYQLLLVGIDEWTDVVSPLQYFANRGQEFRRSGPLEQVAGGADAKGLFQIIVAAVHR